MGEQLEFTVKHKCDKCGKFKPRPFSYFTERTWHCKDCSSLKGKMKEVVLQAERQSCESFKELIEINRKYYND